MAKLADNENLIEARQALELVGKLSKANNDISAKVEKCINTAQLDIDMRETLIENIKSLLKE